MHEWALAESVVKTVLENDVLKERRVKILLGKLQAIEKEIFEFALDEIMKQRGIRFDFVIEEVEPQFRCLSCLKVFDLNSTNSYGDVEKENIHFIPEMVKCFIKCPGCGSVDFEIIKGRGVSLVVDEEVKEGL